MNQSTIIGLDMAKATFQAHVILPNGLSQSGQFANEAKGYQQFWRFLKKHQAHHSAHVCLEATGRYGEAVALFLHQQGLTVSVVNPARIKAYAQSQLRRNKTDPLDAALIADFCRTQQPAVWTPPSPEWVELQALIRHLADLEGDAQRQRNRLDAVQHSGQPSATVMAHLQAQLNLLQDQIKALKKIIQEHIDRHPDLKNQRDLLSSITGIGELTASKLLAEIRYLDDFEDVRQLVAFAGLNPQQRQSGTSIHGHSHISKMGAASIRAALYMPAIVAKHHNPILRDFAARLANNGLSKMEIIVAIMRKLLHLAFGVLKSGRPFDPLYLLHRQASP